MIDPGEETVSQHRVTQKREPIAGPESGIKYQARALVFCGEGGSPTYSLAFSRAFEYLFATRDLLTICLDYPRHTRTSITLRAGPPVEINAKYLHLENPAFTTRPYTAAVPEMQVVAADPIARIGHDHSHINSEEEHIEGRSFRGDFDQTMSATILQAAIDAREAGDTYSDSKPNLKGMLCQRAGYELCTTGASCRQ